MQLSFTKAQLILIVSVYFFKVKEVLETLSKKMTDKRTVDHDTIIVVDIQHQMYEEARQIIITELKKHFTIDTTNFKDHVSVGCCNHNISGVLSSMINKRMECDFEELQTILKVCMQIPKYRLIYCIKLFFFFFCC